MKRTFICGVCLMLVLATLQYGQTNLGNAKLLHHTEDGVRWTQCAFAPDGVLWVIWVKGDTNKKSGGPIWVMSYDGTTATEPCNVTDSGSILANRPNITVSPKGHVLATWGVVADKATYLRIRDPKTKTWGQIETIAYNYGGDEPLAQMDKDGNIHVFFTDEAGGLVFARSRINGAWEGIVRLNQQRGKQGSLTVSPDGVVHAVWIERTAAGYENVYTQRTLTTGWKTREFLPGGLGVSNHPWIASGPNDVVVAAWEDNNTGLENGAEIRVMRIGSTTAAIVVPFTMQHFPRIVVDSKGKMHVACSVGGSDYGYGIRYTNNVDGDWRTPQTIAANHDKLPGLSANSVGNVAATQSSYTSDGTDIWVYSLAPIEKIDLIEAAFTFSPTTGYPPLTVGLHAAQDFGPNGAEVSYAWTISDGGTAAGREATHVFETAGTYAITLTITDNLGRTDEISKTITIQKTNPLVALEPRLTVAMSSAWRNPQITYNLAWEINPANIPEHIKGYAIYMKEGDGEYARVLTVSPSTFDASFTYTDLRVRRSFALSTLGHGGTESPKIYFQ